MAGCSEKGGGPKERSGNGVSLRDCKRCKFTGNTLKELVGFYRRHCLDRPDPQAQQPTFVELLDAAKEMRWHSEKGKDSHQWQLKNSAIAAFAGKLDASGQDIERRKNFEDTLEIIERLGKTTWGIGPLTVYDTTLRLCQPRGMNPKDVHLHQGAWDGASHLKIPGLRNNAPNKPGLFPKELQVLKPWEIEDFLCVCKGQLGRLFPAGLIPPKP